MKRTDQHRLAKAGVLFVERVVNQCNGIFREIHQEDDFGIDGYIEFTDEGRASGQIVAVQIKSGKSFRSGNDYVIPADKAHFEYWMSYTVPVAGIVVDIECNQAFWVDVSGYLSTHPDVIQGGPYRIPVSNGCLFNPGSYVTVFRDSFRRANDAKVDRAADLFLSDKPEDRWNGFLGLVSRNARHSRLTPYMLALACSDTNADIRAGAADTLSRYLMHPEVSFTVPEDLRRWAETVISRTFAIETVRSLMELIDESAFERGSLGQSIAVMLRHVPKLSEYALAIIFDQTEVMDVRGSALILTGHLELEEALPRLEQGRAPLVAEGFGEALEWAIRAIRNDW